jgi:hypothetical protein
MKLLASGLFPMVGPSIELLEIELTNGVMIGASGICVSRDVIRDGNFRI